MADGRRLDREAVMGLDPLGYLPVAAYVEEVDTAGTVLVTYISPRYEEITGIPASRLTEDVRWWDDRVHPHDRPAYLASYERLAHELIEQDVEYRFRRPDGTTIWLHDRASAVRDEERGVTVISGILTNVTRRREAEEEAARVGAELQATVESRTAQLRQSLAELEVARANLAAAQALSHVGSYELEPATGRTWTSAEMRRIWGVPAEAEFSIDELLPAIHPDDRGAIDEAFAVALHGTLPESATFRIIRDDGETRVIETRAQAERDDAGNVTLMRGSAQDITERRRAEDEIRRLNAELAERIELSTAQRDAATHELEAFAYSVAHDVRAPLRTIDGFSTMVIEDAAERLTPDDLAHLDRVCAAARRMDDLLVDLLGLSRVSRRDMTRGPCDLSALAEEVGDELRAEQPDRAVTLSVEPGLVADADAALLRVIVRDLLENAWKFTVHRPEAHVEVGAVEAGDESAFYVRDDGVGFDMRCAEHLFGAFQRMHPPEQFEGTGIGLATVQRLVRRHGGRVWAEAQPDMGATIFFTLPAAAR